VTRLLATQPKNSISGRGKKLFVSGTVPRTALWPNHFICGGYNGRISAGTKRPRREADHSRNLVLKLYSIPYTS
jgi:hypothetical protein